MPTVKESIRLFLTARKDSYVDADLLQRYLDADGALETQVNVAADKGFPIEGRRNTYTDGFEEWWNIRIPKNASSKPVFRDRNLDWPLDTHVEGIGSTGWDWENRKSLWVGFDFDSITGHAKGVGVSKDELERVKEAASAIPWVEVRKSTGGNGLHLYVYFDFSDNFRTENHTVHAALARTILGMMSTESNFDFAGQVDVCGGNMWIWHRKMTAANGGFQRIRKPLGPDGREPKLQVLRDEDIPVNWKDNVQVITRQRAKVQVEGLDASAVDTFEALANSRRIVPLDDKHKAIIDELRRTGFTVYWVSDHNMLQTHTCAFAKLMDNPVIKKRLDLKGFFTTNSEGKNAQQNCFAFPLDNGAFRVYRHGMGINEAPTWEQDGQGWTTSYFNQPPSLRVASRASGGLEEEGGGYAFGTLDKARIAAEALGTKIVTKIGDNPVDLFDDRDTTLKAGKDGRLVVRIACKDTDVVPEGWLKKKGNLVKIFDVKAETKSREVGYQEYDNTLRALVTSEGGDAGWVYRSADGCWDRFPTEKVKLLLMSMEHSEADSKLILGTSLKRRWKIVNLPFQPEYPGNRQWNHGAAQFKFAPYDGNDEIKHPHWDMILKHCGQDLNEALQNLEWARMANIKTGADYLLAWAACMFREPFQPLPYLFFYSPKQNNGKSIFHEALAELMTKGVASADRALTNANDFNGELANAVLAYIEEKDISIAGASAYNKIKDWVTSPVLWVHKKRMDAYSQVNTLHFVHTANSRQAVPMFPGDTRITMMFVPDLAPGAEIPKLVLLERLRAEAPHFMRTIMDLQLPPVLGRLRLPVVDTVNKQAAEDNNKSPVLRFLEQRCFYIPGYQTPFKVFHDEFLDSIPEDERHEWRNSKAVVRDFAECTSKEFCYGEWNCKYQDENGNTVDSRRSIGNYSLDANAIVPPNQVFTQAGRKLRVIAR